MLVDSIVGEKERKTGEILVAMPISQAQIVLGKGMAVVLTIAIQVALWILILLIAGFQIKIFSWFTHWSCSHRCLWWV